MILYQLRDHLRRFDVDLDSCTIIPSNMTTNLTVVPVTEFKAGKNYIAGIRSTRGGKNFCLGALISPSHVYYNNMYYTQYRWVSLVRIQLLVQ
ncbi:hypothetical protein Plhal703r1_c71g0171101 [Plasmopara halstedii]